MAEPFGPLGRAGALTLSLPTLSWMGKFWIGLSSIVLLLHYAELSDADFGIDHDLGRPVADQD